MKMKTGQRLLRACIGLILTGGLCLADATLKGTLGLTMDQGRQVDRIQADHRPRFAAKRTEQNTELRKLRRARIANDAKLIAEGEKVTSRLHSELRQIQLHEDEEIRRLLTPDQRVKFEGYIQLRKEMVGSSRDAKDF